MLPAEEALEHTQPPGATSTTQPRHGSTESDPEHLARVAHSRGDWHTTLRILLQAYGQALRQYCCYLLRDEELAQDTYQTALLQALNDLPGFSGRAPFRVWLYTIARYRCMDTLKVMRSRSRYVVQQEELPEVEAPQATPEEAALQDEQREVLYEALRQLPAHARQVLVLRYFEQLPYEDMARRSGEQAATLRVRAARALGQLRRLLQPESVDE